MYCQRFPFFEKTPYYERVSFKAKQYIVDKPPKKETLGHFKCMLNIVSCMILLFPAALEKLLSISYCILSNYIQ